IDRPSKRTFDVLIKLQFSPPFVRRDHWDTLMKFAPQPVLRRHVDAVRQLGETFVHAPPEPDPISEGRQHHNGPETHDIQMPDLAVYAAGRDYAYVHAVAGLNEADEHRNDMMLAAFETGNVVCRHSSKSMWISDLGGFTGASAIRCPPHPD